MFVYSIRELQHARSAKHEFELIYLFVNEFTNILDFFFFLLMDVFEGVDKEQGEEFGS